MCRAVFTPAPRCGARSTLQKEVFGPRPVIRTIVWPTRRRPSRADDGGRKPPPVRVLYQLHSEEKSRNEKGRWRSPGVLGGAGDEVKGEALRIRESKATKGVRWMPWRQAPKKDVEHCEKPRGAVCRRYIRGCPNGETHRFVARLDRYHGMNT